MINARGTTSVTFLAAVALVLVFAVASVWYPLAVVGIAAAALGFVIAQWAPGLLEAAFLRALAVLLTGYAVFGTTFSHLGIEPLYPGELVLALGLLAMAGRGWISHLSEAPLVPLLVAFIAWGALCTLPYVTTYGLDALRDGVLWGYAAFTLALAPLLVRRGLVLRVPDLYRSLLPWFVAGAPLWLYISESTVGTGGRIGGTGLVAANKSSDVAVHLAGAAAFMLLGLQEPGGARSPPRRVPDWAIWTVLVAGLILAGSWSRGGLLAAVAAFAVVLIARPPGLTRRVRTAGLVAVLVTTAGMAWEVSVDLRQDRLARPQQMITNLLSSFGGTEREGTRLWRLAWWETIVDYTVFGDHFWTGKGFGVNLADDDGFQVLAESRLRSPHNGHLTVLARSGVPGLALWLALQAAFGLGLLRGYLRARRHRADRLAGLHLWVFAYWIAIVVNATFDVYLEGPQGGIWYWCLLGYGMALIATRGEPMWALPSAASPGLPWENRAYAGHRPHHRALLT